MAALTEEQTLIRDQAKAWVTEQAPVQKFREMRDTADEKAFAPATWAAMVEMGWPGIIVPEQYGGSDLGYLTFGLVLEETGRQLTASPLLASGLVGATSILLGGDDRQKQELLPKIVNGEAIVTLAVDEGPRYAPGAVALEAVKQGNAYKLRGTKVHVLEGMAATHLVVPARAGDGSVTLFLVSSDAEGVERQRLSTVDSRGYARVTFNDVTVDADRVLGAGHAGDKVLEAILDRASAGLSAEMQGTACQAFDMTLEYLKTRVQFGQVIGSFQALGHRAADLFTEMELARSCMEAALQALDDGADNVGELVSLSKCRVGEFLHHMSNQLIQIHGGIGMTDEFDAGFYLKRARVQEATFGNRAYHRDRFARALGF